MRAEGLENSSPASILTPSLFAGGGRRARAVQREKGHDDFRCTHSRDSALWFYKSSLRFAAAISLENLRKSGGIS